MEIFSPVPWSAGEKRIHRLLGVPLDINPAAQTLTQQATFMLENAPLLVIGTLDSQGRPWTTVWGGEPGFAQSSGRRRMVEVLTTVEPKYDPVVQALASGLDKARGQAVGTDDGKMFSGLSIDLMSRARVKIAGRMMALGLTNKLETPDAGDHANAFMRFRVDESLGESATSFLSSDNDVHVLNRPCPSRQLSKVHQ